MNLLLPDYQDVTFHAANLIPFSIPYNGIENASSSTKISMIKMQPVEIGHGLAKFGYILQIYMKAEYIYGKEV